MNLLHTKKMAKMCFRPFRVILDIVFLGEKVFGQDFVDFAEFAEYLTKSQFRREPKKILARSA